MVCIEDNEMRAFRAVDKHMTTTAYVAKAKYRVLNSGQNDIILPKINFLVVCVRSLCRDTATDHCTRHCHYMIHCKTRHPDIRPVPSRLDKTRQQRQHTLIGKRCSCETYIQRGKVGAKGRRGGFGQRGAETERP